MNPPVPDLPPVTNLSTAMRAMMDRKFVRSEKYGEQQMRADRDRAHPDILEFEKRMVTRLRKQDVPMFCVYLWRTEHEQNSLYVRGTTKAKWGQSPHNYGMACDLIHGRLAYNLDPASWGLIGHIGKEISVQSGIAITWGGDWKFYDPAHWELKEWKLAKASRTPGQRWQPLQEWLALQ